MCEFVVNSFPFEIIMMGTAARRAGEPFVQQFLDKHSRSCWRPTPRYALFLRRVTTTPSDFSRADVAFVGVPLPAAPYFFVGSRQRGPTFPGRTSPLLASPSPLRLIPSPRHANTIRIFPGGLRLCWRPPTRYALFLHRTTPTRPEISRADAAFVGVPLPAAPCFFASPRQHRPLFSGRTPPLLVSPSPLRLIPPPRHANTTGNILTCWRIWVLENKKAG